MAKKKVEKVEMLTEREARALSEECESLVRKENIWYQLGKKMLRGINGSAPKVLGYKNAQEWMKVVFGASKAKAYRYMRAVKYLKALDEATAARICEGNARLLTRLKEHDANSEEWIERAKRLPWTEFKFLVNEHLYTVYGHPRPEKWINPWPKIPETGELIAEEAIKNICLAQEIDPEKDPEKVGLAFMHFLTVAAQSTPQDLIAFMYDAEPEV